MDNTGGNYKMFSDPLKYYTSMLSDIQHATDYIYLELYRFAHDPIGIRFRDLLLKKCREGVKIKILVDSWGGTASYSFFHDFVTCGGEVRFFKKIKLSWDAFTKNHRRDHRKILVIDDKISYIGSANISNYSLNWRESVFRIKGDIAFKLKDIFLGNFEIYNKYYYDKLAFTQPVRFEDFEILRDVPSLIHQPVRKKFMELISKAQKEIFIETPYFLPGSLLRKALIEASLRGVKVNVVIPKKSDVGIMDLLSNRYFGELSQHGVRIFYYLPQNLHAKLFLVDRDCFVVGSANFDYRSFRYQHEICLVGTEKIIVRQIVKHINETLVDCEEFSFHEWLQRPLIQRLFERMLVPFRHLF